MLSFGKLEARGRIYQGMNVLGAAGFIVNSGYNATMAVQRLLNLKRDGIVGAITLEAINKQEPKKLFEAIQKERIDYIYKIVEQREQNRKFLNGWLKRISKIKFAD